MADAPVPGDHSTGLRIEDILESIPDIIYTLDLNRRLVRWNRRLEAITGFAREELRGRDALDFFVESDRVRMAEAIGRAFKTDYAEVEGHLLRKNGTSIPYHWTGVPLRDAGGRVIGLAGAGRDIAERKQTEEDLATERERLAVTLRSIRDAVLATDGQGRVVLINEVAETWCGRERAQALGRPIRAIFAQVGGPGAEGVLQRCGDGQPHDLVVYGAERRVFEIRTNPITDGPESGGSVVLVRDVSAERQARQEAEEQGRLAAVGQLAAGIAHDFNNILTVIVGISERLCLEGRLRKPVREKLDLVAQQGRRASHLIRQIMDFSRRSNAIERHPIDLALVLEEIVALLRRTIPAHVCLKTEFAPEHWTVRADPTQLQQILTNLALNAWDAMPRGGEVRVALSSIRLHADDIAPAAKMTPGDWVRLSVSDTGSGISADDLPHVFEPFFTTKEPGKGTGLGLAQVYGLVKQHEGFIEATSEEGRGTTFHIYLPLTRITPEEGEGTAGEAEPWRGEGETILLVDDEEAVRDVVTWELSEMGYRVLPAGSGEEALSLYREHRSDVSLVLLDLLMPGLGGVGFYRTLREHDPALPVVVLSGYPSTLGAEADLEGIAEWLQKPLSLGELTQAVGRALHGDGTVAPRRA